LINDILDLEKIEARRFELQRQELDLAVVVGTTLEELASVAHMHDVELVTDLEPAPTLRADRDRLAQVLTNLVSNAVKHSGGGGRVEVRLRTVDDRVRLSVLDEGPGVPVEDRERIFERFHQLDSTDTRSRGGSGLGLAIAKAIVEEHAGAIGVESAPGRGSEFWFELPVESGAEPESDAA
jgi:signal transduction histidine kinase